MSGIRILKENREAIIKLINTFSEEELIKIPEGFNNNILWNLGHLVSTQQLLNYNRSNLPLKVSEEFIAPFRKGTSPTTWEQTPDIEAIKKAFMEHPEILQNDFDAGIFQEFTPYTTSAGVTLNNIEDSINFNNHHGRNPLGIHFGLKEVSLEQP